MRVDQQDHEGSTIRAVATAVPPFCYGQDEARRFSRILFGDVFPDIDRLMTVFDNAAIESRHFSSSVEWFYEEHSFEEKNRLYLESALKLGEEAIRKCLEASDLGPESVDHFIFVSSTGLSTPSIDARLINILGMRNDIRRTPIWGLGCAGGAAGLSRAHEFVRAFPEQRALLLAVELCGLTFQRNDLSKSNLIAASLFADGAAAVLVEGPACSADGPTGGGRRGPRLLSTRSTLWYDSLDVMGWEVNNHGLKVLFSKDIPSIVQRSVRPVLCGFLQDHGLTLETVHHFIAHPGGVKVIAAYEESLRLGNGQMDFAREVLRRYGNMSAPTVLFVLKMFLDAERIRPSEYGVITALGPGFSSEMLLIEG